MHFQRGHPSDLSSLELSLGSSLSDALHFSFALNDNILNENNGHARIDSLPRTRLFSDWDKRMERIKKEVCARGEVQSRVTSVNNVAEVETRSVDNVLDACRGYERRDSTPLPTGNVDRALRNASRYIVCRTGKVDSDCQRCFRECIGQRLRRIARLFRRYACRKLATME